MRCKALLGVVSVALAAVAAVAQPAPPEPPAATPTPTPAPAGAAGSRTVRIAAAPAESSPDISEPLPMNPIEAIQPAVAGQEKGTKGEFVLAPIPISDPAVGSGLGVTAVYTFAKDDPNDASPPPTLGAGGFYTSNDSWSGAAMAKLYLKQDRYRLAFGGAVGSLNYDLFAAGADRESVPISQEFEAVVGQFLVGLGRRWYAGLRVTWAAMDVSRQDDGTSPIPVPPRDLDSTLVEVGLKVERDSRDNVFYPTAGSRLQLFANHNDTGFGSDYTYTKTWLIYSEYFSLSDQLVLAVEGAGCYATDGGPFYSLCMFGSKNLLRGYTVGQYLDRWTLATQAEARWRFAERWIATGFAGVGVVEPARTIADDGTDSLPAAGVGLHWIAAPDNLITVRAEYAIGEGGAHGFYVAIGQAF